MRNNTVFNPFFGDNVYQVQPELNGKPTFDMFSAVALYSSNITILANRFGSIGSFYQGIEMDTIGGTPQNVSIVGNSITMARVR